MSDHRQLPTGTSRLDAPIAWDASSRTLNSNSFASRQISSCSVGCPANKTGTTTFGSFPRSLAASSFALSDATLIFQVTESISTKSTSAPQYRPQLADATKVLGTVQRRSPGPRFRAIQARWSADVALVTAIA